MDGMLLQMIVKFKVEVASVVVQFESLWVFIVKCPDNEQSNNV